MPEPSVDLATLSVAHERSPNDLDILRLYHTALCRIFGHLHYCGCSVCAVADDGRIGSFCGLHRRGCPVCARCDQVMCEHVHLWAPRPVGINRYFTLPGVGMLVDDDNDDDCGP